MDIDRVRLVAQAALAFAVLGAATYLAAVGRLSADAVVALYGAALGAVGSGAVGGIRAAAGSGIDPVPHVHPVPGNGHTEGPRKP